jgi:hypothetical protein
VKVKYKPRFSFQQRTIPDAKKRVGHRQGALVRTIARRSIRKRKKVSNPGQPPTSRTGILKRFIFYSWDATSQSVVVGPEILPGAKTYTPAALEGTRRRRHLKPRPYMGPALEKAKAKLPELWAGAIK